MASSAPSRRSLAKARDKPSCPAMPFLAEPRHSPAKSNAASACAIRLGRTSREVTPRSQRARTDLSGSSEGLHIASSAPQTWKEVPILSNWLLQSISASPSANAVAMCPEPGPNRFHRSSSALRV